MNRVSANVVMAIIIVLLTATGARTKETQKSMHQNDGIIFDFENPGEIDRWRVVNDGVMGGLSRSELIFSDKNSAIFKGNVSLENNGGFASTRTIPHSYELDGHEGIVLRVRGDGRKYQFRLRTDDRFDGISYRREFATEANAWTEIAIPFREFEPTFRGRILKDVKPIVPEAIQQLGFLIANKKAEKFQLEIDWIKAYKK